MAVNSDCAVPEQRHQCPGIGTGNSGQVDEHRQATVAPVGDCLVDEVGDEDDLCAPKLVAGPEQNPSGEEDVVQDEMGGDIGSCHDEDIVLGKEVPDVAELREEEEYPRWGINLWTSQSYRHWLN